MTCFRALKKFFSNLELEGQGHGIILQGSDTPTSARAILHHTDQKGPNNLTGSVHYTDQLHNLTNVAVAVLTT